MHLLQGDKMTVCKRVREVSIIAKCRCGGHLCRLFYDKDSKRLDCWTSHLNDRGIIDALKDKKLIAYVRMSTKDIFICRKCLKIL